MRRGGHLLWSSTLVLALAFVLVLGLAGAASALDRGALAREAVDVYTGAQQEPSRDRRTAAFARAEELFATLAQDSPGGVAVQTNLGNAALQAQHLGVAVLAFKRALAADPSHAQAERNLQHARDLLPAWVPRPAPTGASDSLFFWHTRLSRSARAFAAGLAFALAGAAFGAGRYTGRRALRNLAWLPALVWIALVVSLTVERGASGGAAVLLAEEAIARSSDSAFAPSALAEPLPGGTELSIVDERDGWLQARLANGRNVWLRSSGVARVRLADRAP